MNNLPTTTSTAAAEQLTNLYDVPGLNFHALSTGGCLVYGMLDNAKLVLKRESKSGRWKHVNLTTHFTENGKFNNILVHKYM